MLLTLLTIYANFSLFFNAHLLSFDSHPGLSVTPSLVIGSGEGEGGGLVDGSIILERKGLICKLELLFKQD